MAWIIQTMMEILTRPSIWGIISELLLFVSPLWLAVLIGLFVGWAWKPKWAPGFLKGEERERQETRFARSVSAWRIPSFDYWKRREEKIESSLPEMEKEGLKVTGEDLLHLYRLVEERDGGPTWLKMMEKSLPNMSYQAWRRDPESGPPQYRSSTIFENATPKQVRDFFWDDEFRIKNKWDDMLIFHKTLELCPKTGTMLVHWVRKFPFFCSDREYIIGRRIWDLEGTYYCVTKGVPSSSIPRRKKPRRVDLYYSSWCIRAVESRRRSDGQRSACEVLLFHYEDMGIPWEIAKLGVRRGMWGCVRRIEPGLRAYQQQARIQLDTARINTKITREYIDSLENSSDNNNDEDDSLILVEGEEGKGWVNKVPRFVVIGGAVVLACTLDQGLLTKALIFGVARRFVRQRKRV